LNRFGLGLLGQTQAPSWLEHIADRPSTLEINVGDLRTGLHKIEDYIKGS
jgi:hypothetical protein